jgi:hypothetical protein
MLFLPKQPILQPDLRPGEGGSVTSAVELTSSWVRFPVSGEVAFRCAAYSVMLKDCFLVWHRVFWVSLGVGQGGLSRQDASLYYSLDVGPSEENVQKG